MAKRDPLETLRQMRAFALEASELAANGSREALDLDLGFRRHAERVAELIGEAATRLPIEVKNARPLVPWRQIVSMRNWLIHGYDGIDSDILWDVLNLRSRELVLQLDEMIESWESS
ncbi:DUF86 domain-containing protein [bacterium]|nr:DUF86 domain-containing protein [bacterium]